MKGWKSIGNKLCSKEFAKAKLLDARPEDEPVKEEPESAPQAEDDVNEMPKKDPPLPSDEESKAKDDHFTTGDQINLL